MCRIKIVIVGHDVVSGTVHVKSSLILSDRRKCIVILVTDVYVLFYLEKGNEGVRDRTLSKDRQKRKIGVPK